MTKRVLHIFGQMNRGGAELRTVSLIKPLSSYDITLDFCVLSGKPGVLDNEIRNANSKVYYCPLGIAFPYHLFHLLRKEKFDCVHSHVAMVSGCILFIAWLAGIEQRIAHFRNTHDIGTSSWIRIIRNKFLHLLINLFATNIVAVCHSALDIFWRKNWQNDNRCQVIYNGFNKPDLQKYQADFWQNKKITKNIPIVINLARMAPPKNHLFMIDILNQSLLNNSPFYLVLIGKQHSDIKQQIIAKAAGYHCLDYIIFEDEQADVYPYIKHADVLLFPSLWEGLPGAVIEAASCGLPVVASSLPGISEIAAQLPNIFCLSLKAPIDTWVKQISIAAEIGEEQRQNARLMFCNSPFSIDKCIRSFHALYH